ncbi:DUF1501 domain-containing protein [Sphingomonas sp. AOB5]|uniref:DUF1501 domain-containing protein n=1 Tax=Sphingomonas sp. AOB5 TaxID=3034017 RepID=UPI0023F65520|nr:DUF1501 domain-containing protein [Sphingomonas sp. AOB5]MDF7774324.1 DUF1501 domain-containing protein [Sphingomonas sp. AOB5]
MTSIQSRRAFLRRGAALGGASLAAPFVTNLAAIGEAAAATSPDYKALVCIFLYGGNDYANTLTPYDQASYNAYYAARPTLAHRRDALAATALMPTNALAGGVQYALAPSLAPLLPLFNGGRLAPVLNVGTLMRPTTKAQFLAKSVPLPPKLCSHNDQQSIWQASSPEGASSGWGGRMGDLFQSGNGSAALTCIGTQGNAVYLTGRSAVQYTVGTGGPLRLNNNATSIFGSSQAASAMRSLMTSSSGNMLADEHAIVSKRALETYNQVSSALGTAPESDFPLFPANNSLATQLKIVARMIAAAPQLGAKRQVFFVSMGGFDLHDNLATQHPVLLAQLAEAMRAFHDTTVAMGASNNVTTFTASDFGRTLLTNSDGSDHGWGSTHFVMGGAVKGGRIYGTPPVIGNNTQDDIGQGRLLPTTSVDQYAATLANWFGVSDGDLSTVLPNIGSYDRSTWNLGFV